MVPICYDGLIKSARFLVPCKPCSPAARSFQLLQYPCVDPSCPVTTGTNKASSILRTLFQVPYPVSPLLATLTKTAGVCTNNSHFGTLLRFLLRSSLCARSNLPTFKPSNVVSTYPLSFHTLAYSFALSCTFLHSRKTQPVSFQSIPHSLSKKGEGEARCTWTNLLSLPLWQPRLPVLPETATPFPQRWGLLRKGRTVFRREDRLWRFSLPWEAASALPA
jgi:hypothetical protein